MWQKKAIFCHEDSDMEKTPFFSTKLTNCVVYKNLKPINYEDKQNTII